MLRRLAIQRHSRSYGPRQLLQDFNGVANLTWSSSSSFPFVPEISSTRNCPDEIPENQPASQTQPQPVSEPQPMDGPMNPGLGGQRLPLFENIMLRMSQSAGVRSSLPGSRPLTPSESNRTYTSGERPMTENLQQSRSSPNTSPSKYPLLRVRRLNNSIPPGTLNRLHKSEQESAPVEDCVVPGSQSQQSQQSQQPAEIVQNLSRSGNVLVIPMGVASGTKPKAAEALPQPHSPAPKSSKSKTVSHSKTLQVVEDLDAIMTHDECDEQPSQEQGCAAPVGGNTNRQTRRRTRNNRNPIESNDQESSIQLLNLHRSNASSKTNRKGANASILNKVPCTAINDKAFAKELERMSYHEIIDLRKRNSLGLVYPLNGKRENSAEQQKALEQQIQCELLQRNVKIEMETETETESLSRSVSAEREEMDYREEVMAMPPPVPFAFKDNSQRHRRGREAPMTAELVNYAELSKTTELRRKPSGKRSLCTKGGDVDSVSQEKQPRLRPTRLGPTLGVRDFNGIRATPQDSSDEDTPLCHLKEQNNNLNEIASPLPEFNDNNDNEVDGADCSSSGYAQHRHSKSPLPPVEKSKAKRELENLKISYIHDEVEVDFNETGNRRSKRGQVPLKNLFCHSMDPMKFEWFRKTVDPYDRKEAKPSLKPRRPKKRQDSAAAAVMPLTHAMETQTETEPQPDSDPDPIPPIRTPSPSISDDHQAAYMQLMSWLRGHSSNPPSFNMEDCSGSRVGNTVSLASELDFTNYDGIEYAFYKTKEKGILGYMRFQPLQTCRKKLAKSVSLNFVVLYGQFALNCTVPDVAERDRRILNVGDMAEIEIGTRFGFSNLLNEVSVLMFIRHITQ
ncbi:Hypothetical predicted protein [Drosophila guanche]|uniref:Uncharacterized protein n=1 Tax=Drosophila guanche TaxID=7266 RepID=A0A3B0JVI6_DROGU|nr:Hypothetical predicted protein [Drosophila guanche]